MRVWQTFWVLFVLIPLTIAWAFSVFDIFRRGDLSGWAEVPHVRAEAAARDAYEKSLAADQIAKLAALHTQGELTDQEFATAKAHLLLTLGGSAPGRPAAAAH